MPSRLLLAGLVLLLALPASTTIGQERPTFSAQSELVVLHVTVEGRKGTYVSGLPQDAFIVFEDNRPQTLRFFSAADTPATIGLIIDNSTSMMNKREMVISAVLGFTELSNPDDEVFVLAFNEDVTEIWPPRVIRESNLVSMRATLTGGIGAKGRTALYDAIAKGLERLKTGRHTRQVLVVFSDGTDNASATPLDRVLEDTRSSDAAIFTVALRDPIDLAGDVKLLRRISDETGGEAFEPKRIDQIPATLQHIARDIRSAYTIGYEPTRAEGARVLRKLRVSVRSPDGRTLKARTRGGYLPRGPKGESDAR